MLAANKATVVLLLLTSILQGLNNGVNAAQETQHTCLYDIMKAIGFDNVTAAFYEEKFIAEDKDIHLFNPRVHYRDSMLDRLGIANRDHLTLFRTFLHGLRAAPVCGQSGVCMKDYGAFRLYLCDCKPGTKGDRCQTDVCNPTRCGRFGRCHHTADGFECRCQKFYSGAICDVYNSPCSSSPCLNHGICTVGKDRQVHCACSPGYTGDQCQASVDTCASSPCRHGGSCVRQSSGYRCMCTEDYFGLRCNRRVVTVGDFGTLPQEDKDSPRPGTDAESPNRNSGSQQRQGAKLDQAVTEENQPIIPENHEVVLPDSIQSDTTPCVGIIGWRYVPWSSWRSGEDRGMLRLENYVKKRDETYLKITFNSVMMQIANDQCAQWSIRIDGGNCSEPAPIQTIIHTFYSQTQNNYADRRPAQLVGMCRASTRGPLRRGAHAISIHVDTCPGYDGPDASTGWAEGMTSFLMVEEYCPSN